MQGCLHSFFVWSSISYRKKGIVITTDSLLFQIQMSEHMAIFSSFSAIFPPHYHNILAIS